MYKHKIIEDVKKQLQSVFTSNDDETKSEITFILSCLKEATEVYVGEYYSYQSLIKKNEVNIPEKFFLPHNPVLFSAKFDSRLGETPSGKISCPIQAVMLIEELDMLISIPFYFYSDIMRFCLFHALVRVDNQKIYVKNVRFVNKEDVSETMYNESVYSLYDAIMYLDIINCKNISLSTVTPDGMEKRNRKRRKQGKHPIEQYKILTIDPYKARGKSAPSSGERIGLQPVHLCRGHFKEYTDTNPLFGKYTGRFWWQPHVRGDKKNGVIEKDYMLNI